MKITVGLGNIDDYIPFVKAGADELFCGYVPDWWNAKYGRALPLNRREVSYYNVQIGSISELQILHRMVRDWKVPVHITLNSLYYGEDAYPDVLLVIRECIKEGFSSFILADPGLIWYVRQQLSSQECQIHLSGELGEMNTRALALFANLGIRRVIFHRKVSLGEMQSMVDSIGDGVEYEAFCLNEMCHYHGGFCNTMHCDELPHMCLVPYGLSCRGQEPKRMEAEESAQSCPGTAGCGLCALYDLREAGIQYLKLVSRGNYTEDTLLDIQVLRQALAILGKTGSREEYKQEMKKQIFPEGCSGNCYYREI